MTRIVHLLAVFRHMICADVCPNRTEFRDDSTFPAAVWAKYNTRGLFCARKTGLQNSKLVSYCCRVYLADYKLQQVRNKTRRYTKIRNTQTHANKRSRHAHEMLRFAACIIHSQSQKLAVLGRSYLVYDINLTPGVDQISDAVRNKPCFFGSVPRAKHDARPEFLLRSASRPHNAAVFKLRHGFLGR